MTNIKDLRKSRPNKVPFSLLKVGDVYEDNSGNFCIKTSDSKNSNNCIYFNTNKGQWESQFEELDERVLLLKAEINILS